MLLSWAVPKGLSQNPKDKRLAVMVEDHPIEYANFEGVIQKGNYGAGSVEIFDSGNYEQLESFNKGLKKGHLKFVLNGKKHKGAWSLVKTDEKNWLAIKENDEFAVTKNRVRKRLKIRLVNVMLNLQLCLPKYQVAKIGFLKLSMTDIE